MDSVRILIYLEHPGLDYHSGKNQASQTKFERLHVKIEKGNQTEDNGWNLPRSFALTKKDKWLLYFMQ